jgi:hypothetical protein
MDDGSVYSVGYINRCKTGWASGHVSDFRDLSISERDESKEGCDYCESENKCDPIAEFRLLGPYVLIKKPPQSTPHHNDSEYSDQIYQGKNRHDR